MNFLYQHFEEWLEIAWRGVKTLAGIRSREKEGSFEKGQNIVAAILVSGALLIALAVGIGWLVGC